MNDERWDLGRFWISLLYQLPKKKYTTHTFRWVIRTLFRYFLFFLVHSSSKAKRVRRSFKWTAIIQTKQKKKQEIRKEVRNCDYIIITVTKVRSPAAHSSMLLANRIQDTTFFVNFFSAVFLVSFFIRSFVSVFRYMFELKQLSISIFIRNEREK